MFRVIHFFVMFCIQDVFMDLCGQKWLETNLLMIANSQHLELFEIIQYIPLLF